MLSILSLRVVVEVVLLGLVALEVAAVREALEPPQALR
jgi:hypothetical protein